MTNVLFILLIIVGASCFC
ncbi:YjcZ family sporulation protein [Bacillus thuringiensis]